MPRSPEIMHGLGNLIQNAVQFARREVSVTTSWSEDTVAVDIVDDGPGFPQQVLAGSANPISRAAGGEARSIWGSASSSRRACWSAPARGSSFANLAEGGAQVVVEWRRATSRRLDRAAAAH